MLPGWFWIPILINGSGAEGAKHVHNIVGKHLHLPFCLQRGDPLPVHIHRFPNSLVRHFLDSEFRNYLPVRTVIDY